MKLLPQNFYTPFFIVTTSVVISLLLFFIINSFIEIEDFYYELFKSIIMPIAISLPISLVTTKYHKKIASQKKELEELNKLNSKLISVIAHDIRSPLSVVKGFVEIIHDDVDNQSHAKVHERLHTISERVDNLLLFLNDLLKWTKNQIQSVPLTMSYIDPKKTFDKIIDTYSVVQNKKKISVTTDISLDLIFSDQEIYAFMARNLYYNALKFTNNGGSIHIQLKRVENKIHTVIKDTGIGISKTDISKILDVKQWYSTSGTSNEKGTGLGIKTIIQYLKICNGELFIDSKQNKGTTITVILPIKKEIEVTNNY